VESFDFELKVKPKKRVKIGEKSFELGEPTVAMAARLGTIQDGASDLDKLKYAVEFMESLGLPREVSEELSVEAFKALIDYILGSKKN